jgi:hypothetical protein
MHEVKTKYEDGQLYMRSILNAKLDNYTRVKTKYEAGQLYIRSVLKSCIVAQFRI